MNYFGILAPTVLRLLMTLTHFDLQLHTLTVGEVRKSIDFEEEDDNMACPLTTPAFHFCFALIRAALTRALSAATSTKSKSPVDDSDDETLSPILKGLAVINEHAMLRGNASDEDVEVSCH